MFFAYASLPMHVMQQHAAPFGFRSRARSYAPGIVVSLVLHILCTAAAYTAMRMHAGTVLPRSEVFSVTIEGGEKLGGISQVPKETPGKKKPLPNVHDLAAGEEALELEKQPDKQIEKKLTEPSVVEDPEKLLAEKKAKEAAEAEKQRRALDAEKKAADKKKTEEEAQKKATEKKAAEEQAQKDKQEEEAKRNAAEAEAKKNEQAEKAAREKKLQQAIRNAAKGAGSSAASLYKGESANAGGEGFGAAALGGKGMGGGTLASVEFIAYKNELERRVKAAWRWLPSPQLLKAQALVKILPDGAIQDVRIVVSSGNSNFDESVTRAIYKASPLPPAPPTLYEKFREVSFSFDSRES